MSAPTVRDNLTLQVGATEGFFARLTILERSRQVVTGAATRPERTGLGHWSYANASAPTIRWGRETIELGDEQGNLSERYRILNKLCVGAEAQLFVAERVYDNERVILKIYHEGIAPEQGVLERVSLCSAEHVVSLHEHGCTEGQFFEVQEYVSDATLLHLLGSHPIDEYHARLILHQVAAALAHLHTPDTEGRFLVHRDIKPANILIRTDTPTLDLVLCDFGIASLTGGEGASGSGRRDCTPRYASPETYSGIITPKADYWSLGIILVEALHGRHPLEDIPDDQIESLVRDGWRPDTSALASPEWLELLAGLTQSNPVERWGYKEVERWLGFDTAQETESEAETDGDFIESFDYLKADTLSGFVVRLIENWNRVAPLLDDSIFRRFLIKTINRLAPDKTLEELLDQTGHPDIRLLKFIYRLCPTFPLYWKGKSILRHHLAKKCCTAIAGDTTLRGFVEELYEIQVLNIVASLLSDNELGCRAENWKGAVKEYSRITDLMVRCGPPEERFPDRAKALVMLYLIACEDADGLTLSEGEITNSLIFSFPWLQYLRKKNSSLPPAQRLLRSLLLPSYIEQNRENFRVSHADPATATRIESHQVHAWGWRAPTVSLRAVHIDYEMNICGEKTTIAKGVMLTWNVRGALISYLSGFGFVASDGQRPNERMSRWATYKVVDKCGCENHNAIWFTLNETTVFTLTAIGPTGVSVYRLPPIVVPPLVLEPQAQFTVPLLPREKFTVSIPQLLPQAGFTVPMPQLLPQLVFTVKSLTGADLLEQAQFTVKPLSRKDLLPAPKFIE